MQVVEGTFQQNYCYHVEIIIFVSVTWAIVVLLRASLQNFTVLAL